MVVIIRISKAKSRGGDYIIELVDTAGTVWPQRRKPLWHDLLLSAHGSAQLTQEPQFVKSGSWVSQDAARTAPAGWEPKPRILP